MSVSYSPKALDELTGITRYYEVARPGLGNEFSDELDTQILLCCENPEMGSKIKGSYRRLVLQRFPFNIIYRLSNEELQIIAVAHQRCKPGYWKTRLSSNDQIKEPDAEWPVTFEQNEDAQLGDMLKVTPAQRLAMAEELQAFAIKAGALKENKSLIILSSRF